MKKNSASYFPDGAPSRADIPTVSARKCAEFLQSLKDAEARIASGQFIVFDPETFVERLMKLRADAIARTRKDNKDIPI